MKKISIKIIIPIICSALIIICTIPGYAEMATMAESRTVAENWITLIVDKKGSWGDSETAKVEAIYEFKQKNHTLGFFCKVTPRGFIILSLRKELAPIKAYSAESNLDPMSEEGLADLIKGKMARMLNGIERQLGPIKTVRTKDLKDKVEIDYSQVWDKLSGNPVLFREELDSGAIELSNYQEGNFLLTSYWHQMDPYNRQTPAGGSCTHTLVGCVATAGAQIMRYWNWPPYGEGSPFSDSYDWVDMPDRLTTSSPSAEIDAVAELCHEYGIAVDMEYGCDLSNAYVDNWYYTDMEDAFEDNFRYTTDIEPEDRNDYSADEWFTIIKNQINANQPIAYRVTGHAIVADGWQEIAGSKQYHMNYGWVNESSTVWYTLDALYLGGVDEEWMQIHIRPAQSLGGTLSGTYSQASFPYRYFNKDATGSDAAFSGGQYLQFLPNVTVTNTSTTGGSFRFEGSDSLATYLFTRGDTSAGVKISSGVVKMTRNGGIKIY